MGNCQHLNTVTMEDQHVYTGEFGPEFEITSYEYCLDCGAEVETPTFDILAVDHELTVYELEIIGGF